MSVLRDATAPVCVHCNTELSNWRGNVMVSKKEMFEDKKVQHLQVWCKECTTRLDKNANGRDYHNLWELSWLKETYFEQMESLVNQLESPVYSFSPQAILDCVELGRILYDNKVKVEEFEEEY